jgi:hypothetical protein
MGLLFLGAGCGGADEYLDSSSKTCRAHGRITDLSLEPRLSADYLHRWATTDGCAVRLDVLMTRQGEDSCGGEEVADILMGQPLGTSTSESKSQTFIRDPQQILTNRETSQAFDADAQLPAAAEDTGFHQDGLELWMRPRDHSFVYLVNEDGVEAWPQATGQIAGCA